MTPPRKPLAIDLSDRGGGHHPEPMLLYGQTSRHRPTPMTVDDDKQRSAVVTDALAEIRRLGIRRWLEMRREGRAR